jgi:hypothetical protein
VAVPLEPALAAGTDPRRHAVLLSRAWEAMVAGREPACPPRPLIAESWERAQRAGVDPERGAEAPAFPREEVERRRDAARLPEVLDIIGAGLGSVADDAAHLIVVSDAEGCLLWRAGNRAVRLRTEALGLIEGGRWDEGSAGTNAIGTGLVVRRPVQVFAAEHFVRAHHPWTCSAAPLRDPVDGRLLAMVGVAGPLSTVHPSTLALVDAVTRLAHAALRQKHSVALAELRGLAAPVLARTGGPAFVADRHGWVAAAIGMSPGERVILPKAPSRGSARIPSIGWSRFEPLFGGWLIRLDPSEPDRPTSVRLNLRDRTPSIVVISPSGSWRCWLTPRHAEILSLLALHPGGRSARQLSADLFGDPAHAVTVRAEMSRIRRRLGSLLAQRPYRFAPGLDVDCS